MTETGKHGNEDARPLADRRADMGAPQEDDTGDIADEYAPSHTDPPNAEADAPGGEDDGYTPQTRV